MFKHGRWILVLIVPVVVVLTAATLQARVNQYRSLPLDRQNLGASTMTRTTHGGGELAGWGYSDGMSIHARGGIAATLSATVSGGPIQFRIYLEVGKDFTPRYMKPSRILFQPGPDGTKASSSYTFVTSVRPDWYTVNIQWGSPTKAQVTLHNMTLTVQYSEVPS